MCYSRRLMNLWVRIWKTLELLMGTVTAIGHELIQYYLSPYALLRIMQLLSGLNRRIRQVWVTKRGRKPLSDETRTLIIELKTLNPRILQPPLLSPSAQRSDSQIFTGKKANRASTIH